MMKYYNIPIFVPHKGCPHDCVFCNQKRITGKTDEVDEKIIADTIEKYLKTLPKNSEDTRVEVAFFGGSFTGIEMDMQQRFLKTAYKYVQTGEVYGIRLSTRPDYINDEILEQLKKYGVTTIELGVQSMVDDVLEESNRGHTSEDVEKAVLMIKKYGFSLGLQMMTGLPGDTYQKSVETADRIIALKPDFVRIYPTLVLKDTKLEDMYESGEYIPSSVEDSVILCKELLKRFNKSDIKVIRIALQTTDEISKNGSVIAGPFDEQFRELVENEIYFDDIYSKLKEIKCISPTVLVNNRELSKAVGRKRKNIERLSEKLGCEVKIKPADDVKKGWFVVYNGVEREGQYCISKD